LQSLRRARLSAGGRRVVARQQRKAWSDSEAHGEWLSDSDAAAQEAIRDAILDAYEPWRHFAENARGLLRRGVASHDASMRFWFETKLRSTSRSIAS
jgi:hypothetical protein